MKNYEDLWKRWYSFLNVDTKTRKEILDSLHLEVKKGFDVVVKIGIEESGQQIENKELFDKIKDFFEASLSLCVLSGYALFLVEKQIDPIDANLLVNIETNELGNRWIAEYEKDEHKGLLLKIDPVLSLFLEKNKQDEMNKILIMYEDLHMATFKDVTVLDTFLNWSTHQGYILAMIEQDLMKKL